MIILASQDPKATFNITVPQSLFSRADEVIE
jgi:hypothetical protein